MSSESPSVVVIAGPNGAGKTTASRTILAETLKLMTFVNADVIAQGLSGFSPESAAVEAGRIMLERLHALAARRADFAFETTLAARSPAGWLRGLRDSGYLVHLVYCWLSSPDVAVARVAERVRMGGHDVPETTIRQRCGRSVMNLFGLYRPAFSSWQVFDNTEVGLPRLVARRRNRSGVSPDQNGLESDTGERSRSEPTARPISELLADDDLITAAFTRAAREAVLKHAREGHPVATWRDGQVVWITPDEILARFGGGPAGSPPDGASALQARQAERPS